MAKKSKRERVADRRVPRDERRLTPEESCKHIWQPSGECYWCGLKKEWVVPE